MPVEPNPYDSPALVELRKSQGDPLVCYIVVRESLGMSPGKIASQVGHGVQMLMLRYARLEMSDIENTGRYPGDDARNDPIDVLVQKVQVTRHWIETSYRKIVLRADDKEWEKLKEQLWCFVVRDAGLTEVASGSETVLVLWPMRKSEVPKLVKRLQVLK